MVRQFLVAILMLVAATGPSEAAKRLALIIGNGNYANLPKIEKVENDVRLLRETLSADLGFDVNYAENASRREMSRQFAELEKQAGPDDVVVLYYAGHGVSLANDTYLLPTDIEQAKDGEEQFVANDSFGLLQQTSKLRAKGVKAIFVFVDASRDNPFKVRTIGSPQGLERLEIPNGMFALYSTGYRRASYESLTGADANPNSVFVRSLVPVLKQRGLNQVDMARKMEANVSAAAADAGLDQKPVFEDKLGQRITLNTDEDGVFVEGGDGNKQVVEGDGEQEAEPAAQQVAQNTNNQAAIMEEWKIVKASGNRDALEGFKEKYGNDPVWGPLVDEALAKAGGRKPRQTNQPVESTQDDENRPLYRDLQKELRRIGCYDGPLDGNWGDSSRRALRRASQRTGEALTTDEDSLDALIDADAGLCSSTPSRQAAAPARKQSVDRTPQRQRPKRRVVSTQSSIACWTCHTYDYTTTRVCLPRRIGNPEQRIAPYIRCRPAGAKRSLRLTSP